MDLGGEPWFVVMNDAAAEKPRLAAAIEAKRTEVDLAEVNRGESHRGNGACARARVSYASMQCLLLPPPRSVIIPPSVV